jgi:polyisoprenoid-binding protein YceI
MSESSASAIPGFTAGRWEIDPNHSEVSFVIRHLGISKVRCRFDHFHGTIVTDAELARSSVAATIEVSSIDSNVGIRDDLIRSADILDAAQFPEITFISTAVRDAQNGYLVDGYLTIRGTARPITLEMQANGFAPDNFGGFRAAFSAKVQINRNDFGVNFNQPIPGSDSLLLGNNVDITLEIEAIRQTDESS